MIQNRLLRHQHLDNRRPTPGKRFLKLKIQTMTHPLFPYNGDLSISHVARCAGVLFVRANVISSRSIVYPTGHVWFGVRVDGGGRGWEKGEKESSLSQPHPSPYFWPLTAPTLQISFSPQPSDAIKIKEGGHNFHQESTEHSLAKITPALQAI